MNLLQELQTRLSHFSERDILLHMGYNKPAGRDFRRLRSVMRDPELGFGSSQFDFKYSAEAYVLKLCEVAGIYQGKTWQDIKFFHAELSHQKQAFKPYLFVDTGFKRTTQPVFALATCEGKRYLHFDKDFWKMPLYEQLVAVYARIQAHMDESRGHIGVWGYIRRYYFVYDESGSAIEINPAGKIVAAHDHFQPDGASLGLGNKSNALIKAVGMG